MVVRCSPRVNGETTRPPLLPGLRFTQKYREILSFLFDLGHGANLPMLFSLFGICHPASKNEYGKLTGTLDRLVERGLLQCLSAGWHNGTIWILTELGVAWGRYFTERFLETRAFLQRRDEALQNDPFRASARPPGNSEMAVTEMERDHTPVRNSRT